MVGDRQDIVARLKAVLPSGWFPDSTPVLDAILGGLAAGWSSIYTALQYARNQTRLATASDIWLDIIAEDFFGARLSRNGQGDALLRVRIQHEILRSRGTRAAVSSVLTDLTGRAPAIFEPFRPADTGAWGSGRVAGSGIGYGTAGGWGSLSLPYQCFVTAYRPNGSGIANVTGWTKPAGGYGVGAIEYGNASMSQAQVTDSDILCAIASVMPVAAVAWTRISN